MKSSHPGLLPPTVQHSGMQKKNLKKYDIWKKIKNSAAGEVIFKGINGIIKYILKPGDPVFGKVHNLLVGNNGLLCQKAERYLKKHGLQAVYLGSSFDGEAKKFGRLLARLAAQIEKSPIAYILGGETTVKLNRLNNNGLGGRNQESILGSRIEVKISSHAGHYHFFNGH